MAESREGYVPSEHTGFKSKNEPTQEQETEQNIEAENEQAGMDQAAEEAAEDIADELNLEKESAAPPSPETRRGLTKRISEAIKHYWRHTSAGAVAGFAGASAARIAIKQGVLLSLGASSGAGAIAGGVAGAAIEGARVYIKERKKFVAEDIIEQMNNARNPQEKAAIVAKAESALKEARISDPGKTSELVDAVRAARLHLETELEKDELKGKSEAQQISWLLKSAGRNLKEVPRSEKKNAKALLKKVAFASEKSKVDYKKVGKAVVKGALAGALGGAIGGALAHYVFDNLHPGQWMEKAVEPIMESNPGIGQEQAQAMAEEALRQKAEAAAAAAARVLEEGRQQLLQENFTGEAERGDGWTHLARKTVHDYLVNLRELSPESAPDLNMEQLVHIEDTIVKEQLRSGVSELIHPGQKLELRGEHIQSLISKAQELSPEKIQNISKVLQMPEHYIAPTTIAEMTDYTEVAHADNDFVRAVSERSQEAAKLAAAAVSEIAVPEAVSRAVPKAPETLTEKTPAPAAETAKETSKYAKAILAVLGAGALAGGGYAAKRAFGEKLVEAKEPKAEKPVIQKHVPKAPVAPAPAEAQPVPAPEEKTEEDKISPQESTVAAAAAAGALAGAATAGAIASAEKKGAPARAPQPSPVSQKTMEQFEKPRPGEEPPKEPDEEQTAAEQEQAPGASEDEQQAEPEKSPRAPEPDEIEKMNRTRAAAEYIVYGLLQNYSELQKSEDEKKLTNDIERQERFIELVRKYWKEFTLHGQHDTTHEIDPATGEVTWSATIKNFPDLDGDACLFLLKQAGVTVDRDAIHFVAPGGTSETGTVLDTSGTFGIVADKEGKRLTIDHHTAEPIRDVSSTRFLYELLSDPNMGLLEKKPWLEKFVEYVSKEDNKSYTDEEAKAVLDNYGHNFVSLAKENMTFEEMRKFFEDGKYTPYERLPDAYIQNMYFVFNASKGELRKRDSKLVINNLEKNRKESLNRIQMMEQQGFVLDSGDDRFGRILIDTGWETGEGDWLKKNRLDFDAARPQGYGGYLAWLPEKNQFFLKTVKKMDFDISGAYSVRGHYIMHGDVTEKLAVSLQEILAELTGDPKYRLQGELRDALEREVVMRKNIREAVAEGSKLLAGKQLTKDQVERMAKDLKDINFDTTEFLNRILKTNVDALAAYQRAQSSAKKGRKKLDIMFESLEAFNKEPVPAAPTTPKIPAKATGPSAPAAPKPAAPAAEVIAPPTPEAVKTHVDILREHSEKIYQMVINADGFDKLHPKTQEQILDAFYEILAVHHQIAPDLEKFLEKQSGPQLDIQADDHQLQEPENLIFYYPNIDENNKRKEGNTLIVPVVYDPKEAGYSHRSGGLEPAQQIFGLYSGYGDTFLENQNILKSPDMGDHSKSAIAQGKLKYNAEVRRGRTAELEKRYPGFFAKLSSADNWQELNQATQDALSDDFLIYCDLYPERVPGIAAGDVSYAIEVSDEDKNKMQQGTPMFRGEIHRRVGAGKNTFILKLSDLTGVHSSLRSML